jgi:hypothetical protein
VFCRGGASLLAHSSRTLALLSDRGFRCSSDPPWLCPSAGGRGKMLENVTLCPPERVGLDGMFWKPTTTIGVGRLLLDI